MGQNYWKRDRTRSLISRRRLIGTGASAGLGLAALAAVGCGDDDDDAGQTPGASTTPGGSNGGEPRPGGTVRFVQPGDLPHYDPHTETYPSGFLVALCHAGLLKFAPSDDPNALEPQGYLAEEWEQPDDVTFTVKLRPDAVFQDAAPVNGRAVTAEDVKFSFERIKTDAPEFQRRTFFAAVQSIDVIDEHTVRFNMEEAFAPLPVYLADTWNVVIPKEVVEAEGDMTGSAIGAGPFMLSQYDKGVGLRYVKNPNFWGDGPYLDGVDTPIMVDPAAILAAFRGRQLEVMRGLPWADVPGLRSTNGIEIGEYVNVDNQYIRINTQKGPLTDPRVRQAMSLAIDRNVVANGAFQGNGIPCGVFPSAVRAAVQPDELEFYKYDVQKAKQLLADAGYEDGFELENIIPSNPSRQTDMAAVVIDQLRAINVRVTNRSMEYGAYLQAAFSKEFDINIHWGNRYDDPDGYAIEYLQDGGRNFGYWGSDELDEMIRSQRSTLDNAERDSILRDIQHKIAEECYTIGIANWKEYDGWYSKVQNFGTSVHWFSPAQKLGESWLQEA